MVITPGARIEAALIGPDGVPPTPRDGSLDHVGLARLELGHTSVGASLQVPGIASRRAWGKVPLFVCGRADTFLLIDPALAGSPQ